MHCGSCVGRIERAVGAVPGVRDVAANLANRQVQITAEPNAGLSGRIIAAAEAAGFKLEPIAQESAPEDEAGRIRPQLLWAALLSLPVVFLAMGPHMSSALHMLIEQRLGTQLSHWIQLVLTFALMLGPGRGFFVRGVRSLIRAAPDMDALVAIGTSAAFVYSALATVAPQVLPEGSRVVYFESAAVIITFILLGRWLEARAKGQAGAAIRGLLDLQPDTARVMEGGTMTERAISEIRPGDLVQILPGGRVPVDGIVRSGRSYLDESMLTGEPIPNLKTEGEAVTGGTINGTGALIVEVTQIGADTALSRIIALVEQAQGSKLPVQDLINRITLWFVPAVLCIAAVTALLWLALGPGISMALVAGVCVLIIACPCAMGLATPSAVMVGTGRASQKGVLFRSGDGLQRLSEARIIAFDKTGTLTEGRPVLSDIIPLGTYSEQDLLRIVAAVEANSEHPIARAVCKAAEGLQIQQATEFRAVPGRGATAQVDGLSVSLGNADQMRAAGLAPDTARATGLAQSGKTPVFVAIGGKLAGLLAVSDPIKPDAAQTISELRALGLEVAMISGDTPPTAQAVAGALGIETVIAGVSPDQKAAALEDLARTHGTLAFVGDGINDAPALAAADIGIAMGQGTDIAIETAEVVLTSDRLRALLDAIRLSQRTMRVIRQNLFWAFAYNITLIPIAAGLLYPVNGLLLNPGLAAVAMAGSSVFVLSNALRLRRA